MVKSIARVINLQKQNQAPPQPNKIKPKHNHTQNINQQTKNNQKITKPLPEISRDIFQ